MNYQMHSQRLQSGRFAVFRGWVSVTCPPPLSLRGREMRSQRVNRKVTRHGIHTTESCNSNRSTN